MTKQVISDGVVHTVPAGLKKALSADNAALERWEDLTPLARNEWICWVEYVKKAETRKEHVDRVTEQLKEGGIVVPVAGWGVCIGLTKSSAGRRGGYRRRGKKR